LNLLFLCGVTDAGKSSTLRYSVKQLDIPQDVKDRFELSNHNPPKTIVVNRKKIRIFLCSPQELENEKRSSIEIFTYRIKKARDSAIDLLVMPLNIDAGYSNSIDRCLQKIDELNLRDASYFVYLDSNNPEDSYAESTMSQVQSSGFHTLHQINRQDGNKEVEFNRRGRIFASHVKQLL